MAELLSDADVGFGAAAPQKLLSDADVGFAPTKQSLAGAIGGSIAAPSPSQAGSDLNAVAQGAVGGVGSLISGAGRLAQAGTGPSAQRVIAALDLLDAGKTRDAYQGLSDTERQQVSAYRGARPDQQQQQRDALQQTISDYDKPNAAMRAGAAVQQFGQEAFPVEPEHEGIQTGVGRTIGGIVPALAAGAAAGPAGPLAAMAVIGTQAYDNTYKDAIDKGASHEEADNAAGKSAVAQAITMTLPVSRLLKTVPVPLRDGLANTLLNLGVHGVEFGSANALGTFANNYVAQQTYDPQRPLMQGTGQAALEGAIAGLIVPALTGGLRLGERPTPSVGDVLKAPDVDTAIDAATQVAAEPTQVARPTDMASLYREAPAAIPPNASPPILPRILDLINQDNRVAAARPEFIPPNEPQPRTSLTLGSPLVVADQVTPPVALPPAAGAPEAAGAAATAQELAAQTPAELRATRQARERRLLTEPRIAGLDDTAYIPPDPVTGLTEAPLLHEIIGDAATSIEARQLMQDPKYAGRFEEVRRQNNEIRTNYLNSLIGDATDVERLDALRSKQADSDLAATWKAKKPVDAQPVVDQITQILDGPSGKVDVVRTALERAERGLYDADGNLETDPEVLYGVRKNIDTMLSKQAQQQEPMNQHAVGQLMQVKRALDVVISQGAPGFTQYLHNFAEASRPIEALGVLQSKFGDVYTGADKNITYSSFDNRLKQIIKMRETPGINPAKSIPDDVMDALFNLHSSLARTTNDTLGKARGSDTVQNSRAGILLGYTPEAIAHGAAMFMTGGNPIANLAVRLGAKKVEQLRLARASKNRDMLAEHHLNPNITLHRTIQHRAP